MIGVDRIRQQPSGSREIGEHCRSSTMPPVCANAWRMSLPRGSWQRQQGRSSIPRTMSVELLIISPAIQIVRDADHRDPVRVDRREL
jgi:hypothetical protein